MTRDYLQAIDVMVNDKGMTREAARERLGRSERLRDLMRRRALTVQDVATIVKRKVGTVYHWRAATHTVPAELLELIDLATRDREGK